jgi:hypothetical protein
VPATPASCRPIADGQSSLYFAAVHESACGPKRHLVRRSDLAAFGEDVDMGDTANRSYITRSDRYIASQPNVRFAPEYGGRRRCSPGAFARQIYCPFKVPINSMTLWRIAFCLIARKPRTSAAPSRVPRNETIAPSDSSPSCGAGIFFPTFGAPSKK